MNSFADLLKKTIYYRWKENSDENFKRVKSILISNPVVSSLDFTKQFKLIADVSNVGIGGVLLQEDYKGIKNFSKKTTMNKYQEKSTPQLKRNV